MSSRLSGSPPVMTNTFGFNFAMSSISRNPSSVDSSNCERRDCAAARQCTHERSRARRLPDRDEGGEVEVDGVRIVHYRSPLPAAHSRYATGDTSLGLISARPPQ